MCSPAIIGCQSLDEILADKIVSFSQQVLAPRYRDLWDIPWITLRPGRNMDEVAVMVGRKLNDYHVGENAQELLRSGLSRAREALGAPLSLRKCVDSFHQSFWKEQRHDRSTAKP